MISKIVVLESTAGCAVLAQDSPFCLGRWEIDSVLSGNAWLSGSSSWATRQAGKNPPRKWEVKMEATELLQEPDGYGRQGLFCKSVLYFLISCYSSTTHHSPPYQDISTNCCWFLKYIFIYSWEPRWHLYNNLEGKKFLSFTRIHQVQHSVVKGASNILGF